MCFSGDCCGGAHLCLIFACFHEEADKASRYAVGSLPWLHHLPAGLLNALHASGQGQLLKAGSLLSPRQISPKHLILLLWAFPPTRFCHPGQGSW